MHCFETEEINTVPSLFRQKHTIDTDFEDSSTCCIHICRFETWTMETRNMETFQKMSCSEHYKAMIHTQKTQDCRKLFAALVGSRWHLPRVSLVPATKRRYACPILSLPQKQQETPTRTRGGLDPAPVSQSLE